MWNLSVHPLNKHAPWKFSKYMERAPLKMPPCTLENAKLKCLRACTLIREWIVLWQLQVLPVPLRPALSASSVLHAIEELGAELLYGRLCLKVSELHAIGLCRISMSDSTIPDLKLQKAHFTFGWGACNLFKSKAWSVLCLRRRRRRRVRVV